MTCIDAGAQTGFYTCLMASVVGETGMVYAFEPMPASYELLVKNVQENRFDTTWCFTILASGTGETDLEMTVDRSSLMTSHVGKGETVHCVTLDQLHLRPTRSRSTSREPSALPSRE